MTRPDFVQSLAKPQRPHEEEALEGICDPANLADVDGTAPESLPPITPRMEAFSPAESLESNVTLVSAGRWSMCLFILKEKNSKHDFRQKS